MGKLIVNLTLFFLVFNIANASIKGNFHSLSKSLKNQSHKINQIKNQLIEIEKKLSNENAKYINNEKRYSDLEIEIDLNEKKIKALALLIQQEKTSTHSIIKLIVIGQLNDQMKVQDVVAEKTLKKILKKIFFSIQNIQVLIDRNSSMLVKLREKLAKQRNKQQTLNRIIQTLEIEKQKIALVYLDKVQKNDFLNKKYKTNKIRKSLLKTATKKIRNNYISPIENYIDMQHKEKGITIKCRGTKPVISPRNGKVVYIGNLSAFGNVVILSHAKNIRSVLLGEFEPKIKKGQIVKKGQLLGYTTAQMSQIGKVDFEVRIKNKIQNTILLMDRESLTKNNFKKKNNI